VIQHARLLIDVPLMPIQNEVMALTEIWRPHFNIKHYEGNWTVLTLRSPNGGTDQIFAEAREDQEFADTSLMKNCPAIKALIGRLGCPIMAVRLMNLQAGAIIKEHRDHDLAFEKGEARLHFPIFTNPSVLFYVNDCRVVMNEGQCWYINVNLPHKVANYGNVDRIHLVVDCQVNNRLKELFTYAEKAEVHLNDQNDTYKIIRELRLQNTETSIRLADEMERNLKNTK
jgi:mannose-6-phosphate isomerase-like protein (cupin superfamily)